MTQNLKLREEIFKQIQEKVLIHMEGCDCLNCRMNGRIEQATDAILSFLQSNLDKFVEVDENKAIDVLLNDEEVKHFLKNMDSIDAVEFCMASSKAIATAPILRVKGE